MIINSKEYITDENSILSTNEFNIKPINNVIELRVRMNFLTNIELLELINGKKLQLDEANKQNKILQEENKKLLDEYQKIEKKYCELLVNKKI